MGYSVYEDYAARSLGVTRWAGYGVPAECDMPDCSKKIDRGLAYKCENAVELEEVLDAYGDVVDEIEVETEGCGLFFCGDHEYDHMRHLMPDVVPKPDSLEWVHHLLNNDSWELWRIENPQEVKRLREDYPDWEAHHPYCECLEEED